MSLIVGFGHRSGVGKSYACHAIKQQIEILCDNVSVGIYDMASPMKEAAHLLWSRLGVRNAAHYERHREDRSKIIPGLGCNVVELWCKIVEPLDHIEPGLPVNAMLHAAGFCDVLLIPNIRRQAEAEAIKSHGGMLFKIDADVENFSGAKFDETLADYDGWDETLFNDKTEKFRQILADKVMFPVLERLGQQGRYPVAHHPV